MAKSFIKQGSQFYTDNGQGEFHLVQDPDTNKALKSGQIPYQSVSIDRSLTFSSGNSMTNSQPSPSPYYQQSNTQSLNTGGIESSASTSLKGGNDFESLLKTKFMEAMNGMTNSKLPGLESRQRELLTQKLTAPRSDYSQMAPQDIIRSANARGSEYDPAIEQATRDIQQEKGAGSDNIKNLSILADLMKTFSPESQKKTSEIINYEYSKSQGYPGNFEKWQEDDAKRKKLAVKAEMNGMSPQVITKVQQVAGQFDGEAVVKEYNQIIVSLDAVKNAGTTPTDDIQRIYAFAKIMDPNSVVREGEYKTVQDYSTALLERLGLKAVRVFDNRGFLTQEARGFLLKTLNNRFASTEKAYKNIYNEYGRRINIITGESDGTSWITDYAKAFPVSKQSSDDGRITVVNPQGQKGNIPKSQLQEAIKQGYKQI